MDFDDYVGGIEIGIAGVLISQLKKTPEHPDRYLKELGFYEGELDEKTLRENVNALQSRMPAMLIAYTGGEDVLMPATSPVRGQPRTFRQDCTFSVLCCAQDARGIKARRQGATGGTGVYQMIADARQLLAGWWFLKRIPEEGEPQIIARAGDQKLLDGDDLLTFDPLKVYGVEYLAWLPDITVFAVHFQTYFKWTEPDRRGGTTAVTELIFDASVSNSRLEQIEQLPGVTVK